MIKCPRCNADMIVDATIILTSYPPQYTLICPECGHTITRQCSECEENKHLYTFDEVNELQKKAHRSEYERGYRDGYKAAAEFCQKCLDDAIKNMMTTRNDNGDVEVKINGIKGAAYSNSSMFPETYSIKANWVGTDPMSVGISNDPQSTKTLRTKEGGFYTCQ